MLVFGRPHQPAETLSGVRRSSQGRSLESVEGVRCGVEVGREMKGQPDLDKGTEYGNGG